MARGVANTWVEIHNNKLYPQCILEFYFSAFNPILIRILLRALNSSIFYVPYCFLRYLFYGCNYRIDITCQIFFTNSCKTENDTGIMYAKCNLLRIFNYYDFTEQDCQSLISFRLTVEDCLSRWQPSSSRRSDVTTRFLPRSKRLHRIYSSSTSKWHRSFNLLPTTQRPCPQLSYWSSIWELNTMVSRSHASSITQ